MPSQSRSAALCPLLLTLVLFFSVSAAAPARAGETIEPGLAVQLQSVLESTVTAYDIAGASALVRAPDGTIWTGQAGLADRAAGTPWTRQTKCGIGSTSKTFTSTVFLQLVQEGRVGLSDTVADVLPGLLPNVGGRVTMENLLLMQSGLIHYENQSAFIAQMEADPTYEWQPAELAALCDELAFEPGDHFDYCNINYFILGLVIESLDGRSFAQSLQTRILDPLGLKNTGLMTGNLLLPSPGATPYRYDEDLGQVMDDTYYVSPSIAWASGAIYSTVDDLLAWLDAFWRVGLLNYGMFAYRTALLKTGRTNVFGPGYAIRTNGALGFAGNFNDVFTSEWETKQDWCIVALTNGYTGPYLGSYTSASSIYWFLLQAILAYDFPPPGGPESG